MIFAINFRYDDTVMKLHPTLLLLLLSATLVGCSNLATTPSETTGEMAPPQTKEKEVIKNAPKMKTTHSRKENTKENNHVYTYLENGFYDDSTEEQFLFAYPEEQCDTLFSSTKSIELKPQPPQKPSYLSEEEGEVAPTPVKGKKASVSRSSTKKRNALVTVKNRNLWCRIREGYKLLVEDHPDIQQSLEKYLQSPRYLENLSLKAKPYLYHIVKEIERRHLPMELALLPAIESGYEPLATSSKSAAGIWQFIPETGNDYGLDQTPWYDGRRDFLSSTRAALDYLERLHDLFNGDWLIALAAYNYGEGNIRKAINKNEVEGKTTDFWSLVLPNETRWYVPKLLALAKVIAHPKDYGVRLASIPDTPYLTQIDVGAQISLSVVARLSNLPTTDVARLNACYRLGVTPPEGPQKLMLPVHKIEKFKQKFAQLSPQERLSPPDIEEQIKMASQILSSPQLATEEELPETQVSPLKQHRIAEGETLGDIAKRYATTVAQLLRLNHLQTNAIKKGQVLKVPAPDNVKLSSREEHSSTETAFNKKRVIHVVKAGDSLMTIARDYQVSVDNLTQWNGLQKNLLRLGQKLTIWRDS